MDGARGNRWQAFWQLLTRVQLEKLDPWIALRNAVGITLPIAAGVVMGAVRSGLAASTGALNVAFTDSHTPYIQRAERMLRASVVVGCAVFLGCVCGSHHTVAVFVTVGWAFMAGMLVALSTAAADVGVISLATLLVFSASPLDPATAAGTGLLAFAGGLLQTFLAIALWPIRRYEPERKALGNLFLELSRLARSQPDATQPPPSTSEITAARDAVDVLSGNHSVEADRYRLLLIQAERMRLAIITLTRLQVRLRRELPEDTAADGVESYLAAASQVLGRIAARLLVNDGAHQDGNPVEELEARSEALRAHEAPTAAATLADARFQVDALSGQLRAAVDLAAASTPRGQIDFSWRELSRPASLRLEGAMAILRANLSLQSAAFRHAVRLAVCVGIGDALGRMLGWQRTYWLPMTIAIILKPDFTATFSRGVLRLVGTFAGLLLATGLLHILPAEPGVQVGIIAVTAYVMRWMGPANYGIFVTALTALVVALVTMGGTAPQAVIAARAANTSAGGVIALLAYIAWPTWERLQVSEALAQMFDTYREYFRTIRESYVNPEQSFIDALDRSRSKARLARTNLEASVDRLSAEPGVSAEVIAALHAILATSHRLVHALMALEADLSASRVAPAREMFYPFADQVELTMYYMAARLRGAAVQPSDLPDLRAAHHALVHSAYSPTERYALVNVETDRITNALNTLREKVFGWVALNAGAHA